MPITDHIDDIKRIDSIEVLAEVPSMYISTSNVITQGNIAIDATTVTKNFSATTYTGNGTTQDIVTGISSVDFTVSANGSGFWLDRTVNQVKNDAGVVQASGDCVVNTSKVHVKSRSVAVTSNVIVDGLRGSDETIYTDRTDAESYAGGSWFVYDFSSTGFSTGSGSVTNGSSETYIAYQTLYTHIKWGVTSQGKFQIEAYNPVTKEGMIYYLGSGVAGHQISHSQGVEIDYIEGRSLDTAYNWVASRKAKYVFALDAATAETNGVGIVDGLGANNITLGTGVGLNGINEEYIMYYKCKSETFTIGTYQGTGAAGNFIETKDINGVARRPRRVVIKAISTTGNWVVNDSARNGAFSVYLNTSGIEDAANQITFEHNGFKVTYENAADANVLNVTYLYQAEFDTNGNGGDSYFPLPTDDTNLNLTGTVANYTNGKDENGFIRSTETVTASVDLAGVSDGFKWVAKVEGGSYNFYDKEPSVGLYEKESADDNRLVFSDGKYYSTTGGELVTNGTFDTDVTGWTASEATLSVESGRLKCVTTNNIVNGGAFQAISVTAGEKYRFEYTLEANTDHAYFYISSGNAINLGGTSLYTHQVNAGTTETNTVDFTALETGDYYLNFLGRVNTTAGDIIYADNISVYKIEATLGTPLTTPISLIPNPVMVQSETPMYIDYSRSLSENVMESTTITDLKVTDGFDLGQKWVDVTSERASGVTYTNNTGKPIEVSVTTTYNTTGGLSTLSIDGVVVSDFLFSASISSSCTYSAIIQNNSTYVLTSSKGIKAWLELR